MHIGFDARSLFSRGTGDQTYLRNLLSHMARLAPGDNFTLFFREGDAAREQLAAQYSNMEAKRLDFPVGWLWGPMALPPRLKRDGIQALHGNYLVPPLAPCPTVVTIHDITFRLFPQWFPPRACRIMNVLIPLAARTSTRILTVSEHSKRDIVRHFKVPSEKVVVTLNGVAPTMRPAPPEQAAQQVFANYALEGAYLLGVGLRGTRKNIGVVLRAMLQLQASGAYPSGLKLALAGQREQFPDPEIEKLGDTVRFLGYIAEEDLPALYSAALACVYPSFYEGFGLPPLEAMACGCPVLCSNTSSLPEVVGEAGLLLDPRDGRGWAEALLSLCDKSTRETMRRRGLEQAARFSWEHTARQTLAVYRALTHSATGC